MSLYPLYYHVTLPTLLQCHSTHFITMSLYPLYCHFTLPTLLPCHSTEFINMSLHPLYYHVTLPTLLPCQSTNFITMSLYPLYYHVSLPDPLYYRLNILGDRPFERLVVTCASLKIKRHDDPDSYLEINQGLGAYMYLNPSKTRLMYCTPRFADQRSSTCKKPYVHIRSFIKLQGECVELDTNTLEKKNVRSWCSTWKKPGILPYSEDKAACTQLQLENLAKAKITVKYKHGREEYLYISDIGDGKQYKVGDTKYNYCNAPYQVLLSQLTIAKNFNRIKVHCSMVDSEFTSTTQKLQFNFADVQSVSVSGTDEIRDYFLDNEKAEVDKMSCMLGMGAVYLSDSDVHISSPGYKGYSGSVFSDNGKSTLTLNSVKYAGKTYAGIKFKNAVWAALTARLDAESDAKLKVEIFKDNIPVKTLNETRRYEGFGDSLLFYVKGDSLYLLIGRPYAKYDAQFDCGYVDIYRLENSEFNLSQENFSSVCGRFGSTIVNIGSFTDDLTTAQIAVAAPEAQTVVILDFDADNDAFVVSQKITAESNTTLFGYAVSGNDDVNGNKILAISDALESKVYLYRTLDIVKLSMSVNCSSALNIMSENSTFECKFKFDKAGPYTDKLAITWEVKNDILKEYISSQSTFNNISVSTQPITVNFALSNDLPGNIRRAWNLDTDLSVEFRYNYQDYSSRTVAFHPKLLNKTETVKLDVQGYCGNKKCVADFEILVFNKSIHRLNTTEIYRDLDASNQIEKFHLYKGSGVESVDITFDIALKKGEFMNEYANVSLTSGLSLNKMLTINKTVSTWRQKVIINVLGGIDSSASINISVALGYNYDPDLTNNILSITIPCSTLIDIDSFIELQPSNMPHDRHSRENFPKRDINTLGPSQEMFLSVVNKGQTIVEQMSLAIWYPIEVSRKEVFYITKVEGSNQFWCDEPTNKQINYKGYEDPASKSNNTNKVKNLQLNSCGKEVLCLELVCRLGHLEPGQSTRIIIKTAVDLEHAKEIGNFTVEISSNLTVQQISGILVGRLSSNKTLSTTINILMPLPNITLPVLVAVVIASSLVAILIACLARCGFFRRDKRDAIRNNKVLEPSDVLVQTVAAAKEKEALNEIYDNHTVK